MRRSYSTSATAYVLVRLVRGAMAEPAMTIMHERYRLVAHTGSDMLSHKGEEGGIVSAGRIELTVGGQSRVLGPGDAYHSPAPFRIGFATSATSRAKL